MISIGSIFSGPELKESAIDTAIKRLTKAAIDVRGDFVLGQHPSVNVVFHVPGSLGGPGSEYIQTGKFSRKQQLLLVAVPVPDTEVSNDQVMDFLIDSLKSANAVAFDFFRNKGLNFPLAVAEEMVGKIYERVSEIA